MIYSLQITIRSAQETLAICAKQAVKDSQKVYQVLSSKEAIWVYKKLWLALQIIWAVAVWLFLVAREKLEAYEASCKVQEIVETVDTVEIEESEPVSPHRQRVVISAARLASKRPMISYVSTEVKPLAEMTIRELKAMAAGRIKKYGRMTKSQLIKALQEG